MTSRMDSRLEYLGNFSVTSSRRGRPFTCRVSVLQFNRSEAWPFCGRVPFASQCCCSRRCGSTWSSPATRAASSTRRATLARIARPRNRTQPRTRQLVPGVPPLARPETRQPIVRSATSRQPFPRRRPSILRRPHWSFLRFATRCRRDAQRPLPSRFATTAAPRPCLAHLLPD